MQRVARLGFLLALAGFLLLSLIPPQKVSASGTWSATIDFTRSAGGFHASSTNAWSVDWINGSGWVGAGPGADISWNVAGGDSTTYLTGATIYVGTFGIICCGTHPWPQDGLVLDPGYGAGIWQWYPQDTGVGTFVIDPPRYITGGIVTILAHSHDNGTGGAIPAQVSITKLLLSGTGTPPDLPLDPTAIPLMDSGVAGCVNCTFAPTGDLFPDLVKLLTWILCQLQQIWYCQLLPLLQGLWGTVVKILRFLQAWRQWTGYLITRLAIWINTNTRTVAQFAGGTAQNMTSQITNAIYWQNGANTTIVTGSGSSVWDVLISLFNNLGGTLTTFISALRDVINTLGDVIKTFFNDLLSLALALIDFVLVILDVLFIVLGAVFRVLAFIPQIVGTFIAAFSQAGQAPINGLGIFATTGGSGPMIGATLPSNPGTLDCTTPVVFHVCLALYTLDNTVFSTQATILNTSAMGAIFTFMIGILSFNWILATMRKIRGRFANGK